MRLIDADLLKEKIEEGKIRIEVEEVPSDNIYEQLVYLLDKVEAFMVETIDNMPTAYDVDKVVEQLEEKDDDCGCGKIDVWTAIDIVRIGGKE